MIVSISSDKSSFRKLPTPAPCHVHQSHTSLFFFLFQNVLDCIYLHICCPTAHRWFTSCDVSHVRTSFPAWRRKVQPSSLVPEGKSSTSLNKGALFVELFLTFLSHNLWIIFSGNTQRSPNLAARCSPGTSIRLIRLMSR